MDIVFAAAPYVRFFAVAPCVRSGSGIKSRGDESRLLGGGAERIAIHDDDGGLLGVDGEGVGVDGHGDGLLGIDPERIGVVRPSGSQENGTTLNSWGIQWCWSWCWITLEAGGCRCARQNLWNAAARICATSKLPAALKWIPPEHRRTN